MPNGHGGVPRFGAPVLLAVLLAAVHGTHPQPAAVLFKVVEVVIILLFSWRLAWHLCMWRASEYDGAYVSGEESKRAVIRTVMATLFFSALGCAAWYEFLHG